MSDLKGDLASLRIDRDRPARSPWRWPLLLFVPVILALAVLYGLKARQALAQTGLKRLAVGGGVAANRPLRAALEQMTAEQGAELFIPPMKLCTDNAAMAALAVEKWRQQQFAPLDLDAVPSYL